MTKTQWNEISLLLPPERKPQGGCPAKGNRLMMDGILYWLSTGIAWRDLPERFGPWQSVYGRLRTWTLKGVWEKIFEALIEQDIVDETTFMLDSTTIKAHQHGSGVKKGLYHEETRANRGGLTTKVHAVTDGLGNPLRFVLSSGNHNDIYPAQTLLEPFDLQVNLLSQIRVMTATN